MEVTSNGAYGKARRATVSVTIAIAFLCSLLLQATAALAQESGRTWTVDGLTGIFNTQEDAEKAIRSSGANINIFVKSSE